MKAFAIRAGSTTLDGLQAIERDEPKIGPREILVAMKAASINYRDMLILLGTYMGGFTLPRDTIALSDGAGEVLECGDQVSRFKPGDRVAGTFFRNWSDGAPASEQRPSLGADVDGVLAEYAAFHENDAVRLPANLDYLEAATLPCAGVTAWNALMVAGKPIRPGDNVLALGTGGVSSFALLLGKAAGARVLITSSSDEKLAKAKSLGADATINYKSAPDWEEEALAATAGHGADCVVEVGGVGTMSKSMRTLASGGKICMIGYVAGPGKANPWGVMRQGGNLHGIFVGNRAMFEQMVRAIEVNDIHPVIDKVFPFEDSPESLRYLQSQAHFGKIVIKIG